MYKREIPTQLKVIQARIVAQAGLIFLVCGLGLAHLLGEDAHEEKYARSSWKLRDYSEHGPAVVHEGANQRPPAPASGTQLK